MLNNKPTWPILAVTVGISLTACKILPTPSGDSGNAAAFNPDKTVEEIWAAKVVPYLQRKAGPFAEVHALAKTDPASAGAKYGNPNKQANSPWTFAVRVEGKIIAANTASRAATMDIDVDGDGKADARVQIGPAMRGTALRDSLETFGDGHVLYGTDFPHNIADMAGTLARIDQLAPAVRDNVRGANAQRVFKL